MTLVDDITARGILSASLLIEYHLSVERQLTKLSSNSREVLLPLVPEAISRNISTDRYSNYISNACKAICRFCRILLKVSLQYLMSLSLNGYASRLITFRDWVENLLELVEGASLPILVLIDSMESAHCCMIALTNATGVVGSILLVAVSRYSRRSTSVSSSRVIWSAFFFASLIPFVYSDSLSFNCRDRDMTPTMVPATSAMAGVRRSGWKVGWRKRLEGVNMMSACKKAQHSCAPAAYGSHSSESVVRGSPAAQPCDVVNLVGIQPGFSYVSA